MWGIGLLLAPVVGGDPWWLLILLVTGLGALLAVGWELGEYVTFIRRGIELDGAYEDTLSDQVLGTAGALVAAVIVRRSHQRA